MRHWKEDAGGGGHVAHTRDADTQQGLAGEMRGPVKLAALGAGSGFAPRLVSDVVQIAGSQAGEICRVDRNGFHPVAFGNLPPQMAAICRSNMSMFDLAAQAATEKSRELAALALMPDPLTSAVCTLAQIREMTERLFKAEKRFLKGYR